MDRRMILLLFSLTLLHLCAGHQEGRVLLRDVKELTLRQDAQTTGWRSVPIPQLQCVGGTAHGKFAPNSVRCYNRGSDGVSVQWECKAEMPTVFQFGKISVSCEVYDYPDDPCVLAGSCGLKYELNYSSQEARKRAHRPPSAPYKYSGEEIIGYIILAALLFILFLCLKEAEERRGGNAERRRRRHAPTAPYASRRHCATCCCDFSAPSASPSASDNDADSTYEDTAFGGTEGR